MDENAQKPGKKVVEAGTRFGRLTVLSLSREGGVRWAFCGCECGSSKAIRVANLLREKGTRSCGCLSRETSSRRMKSSPPALKHGRSSSPEYTVWAGMIQRCKNPKHTGNKIYSGRGIRVCERWLSFSNFYADMGPRPSPKHTVERKDNDGPYCPGNCCWATRRQQSRNTRRNLLISYCGETLPAVDWAARIGIRYGTFLGRLRRGWEIEKAIHTGLIKEAR